MQPTSPLYSLLFSLYASFKLYAPLRKQVYYKDLMISLSDNYKADVFDAFNSTSKCQEDLLNIDKPYFDDFSCMNCN